MKFGGSIGSIRDVSGMVLTPRCFGDATLADPSLEPRVKMAIFRALEEHFVRATSSGTSLAAVAVAPDLAATIATAVSAELGTEVTISMLTVMFPE